MSDTLNPADVPNWTAADFTAAFQAMMPHGRVWPRDPASVQARAIAALMPTYVRQSQRSANLLVDAFPSAPVELLPEWEATLGLPDPCTPLNPSMQERQAAVLAKFIGSGGQSLAFFEAIAATLGFQITVTEFAPFVVGDPVGMPIYGPDWAFVWEIQAPQVNTFYFEVGESFAGDPLESYDGAELICRLNQIKPAHTTLFFVFSQS